MKCPQCGKKLIKFKGLDKSIWWMCSPSCGFVEHRSTMILEAIGVIVFGLAIAIFFVILRSCR
ncbi:hypothetical protein A2Z67_02725 [Candidatus Woesebacteria bacterium RBG_13_36_22]|uniref:Uncharacterized protein n=1 Tax=Candidatus Woesebacteria bacterium RBG_13_36_22 TaxID=1802478 RepID=A0A1F7X5X3_9BACT|nr:MAG: hypothetical protein A2Z67_02725 [Candidatus Woesebacteria bacterium RBG_13_36_22]